MRSLQRLGVLCEYHDKKGRVKWVTRMSEQLHDIAVSAFHGGMCLAKNLGKFPGQAWNYYDINSSYPAQMCKAMPDINKTWMEYHVSNDRLMDLLDRYEGFTNISVLSCAGPGFLSIPMDNKLQYLDAKSPYPVSANITFPNYAFYSQMAGIK
jgi:hypothetical protein